MRRLSHWQPGRVHSISGMERFTSMLPRVLPQTLDWGNPPLLSGHVGHQSYFTCPCCLRVQSPGLPLVSLPHYGDHAHVKDWCSSSGELETTSIFYRSSTTNASYQHAWQTGEGACCKSICSKPIIMTFPKYHLENISETPMKHLLILKHQ